MAQQKEIRLLKGEKFKVMDEHEARHGFKYAVSNKGRVVRFKNHIQSGVLVKGSRHEGYLAWKVKFLREDGTWNNLTVLHHQLVAKYFMRKPKNADVIIHLNHDKHDSRVENLKWVTHQEAAIHAQTNPRVIEGRQKAIITNRGNGHFLSEAKVKQIKRLLEKGKTLRLIAGKYGISDMQVHRIKTGENWGWVSL